MWTRRRVLGLAFASEAVTAVELGAGNGAAGVTRAGQFVYPDGVGLEDPPALGAALREFLRSEGFSATRCVIGMEAKWLTSRVKSLPPGPDDSIAGMLHLSVEREFASNSAELLTDYAVAGDTEQQRQVVLYAAGADHVEQLAQTAQAARLRIVAVTSSTVALAAIAVGATESLQCVLNPLPDGMELATVSGSAPPVVRRLSAVLRPLSTPDARSRDLDSLIAELRRTLSTLGLDQDSPPRPELVIPPGVGFDQTEVAKLAERLSLSVRTARLPATLELGDSLTDQSVRGYAAAASLALTGLPEAEPVFDFLHSRMKTAPPQRFGRKAAYAGGVIAAALLGFVVLLLGWQSSAREAHDLEIRLVAMEPSVIDAGRIVANTSAARQWYSRRPHFLECLRELTLAFPEEGRIWATSLGIEERKQDGHTRFGLSVSGKGVSKTAILDVLDRLKANPHFADVKILYLRESGRSQREVAYAMSCTVEMGS